MQLTQIRTDLAALVANVDGILGCAEYAPEFLSTAPFAWLGDSFGPVTMGAREIWTYTLPLTVAVARKADYDSEQSAVEGFVEAIMQAIALNYTLGNTTMGLSVAEFREGVVKLGDEQFVGFTLVLKVKETYGRQLS